MSARSAEPLAPSRIWTGSLLLQLSQFGWLILPFALLLLTWFGLSRAGIWSTVTFPPPEAVAASLLELIYKGILPYDVGQSLNRLVVAVVPASVLGIVCGVLLGIDRRVALFFYPIVNFFQSVAGISLVPLLILAFGFTSTTVIVIIAYTVFFPILFSTLTGIRTVPPVIVASARTLGAGWGTVVWHVLIPGAMPDIVTGLRSGIGYGWRALIAGEMIIGRGGLGYLIFDAQRSFQTQRVVLGMIMMGVLWLLADRLLLKPLEEETIQRWGLTTSAE